jgi:hypothetical protein
MRQNAPESSPRPRPRRAGPGYGHSRTRTLGAGNGFRCRLDSLESAVLLAARWMPRAWTSETRDYQESRNDPETLCGRHRGVGTSRGQVII